MSDDTVMEVVRETPRYKLKEPIFLAPHYVKAGMIIDYDGEPGPHMEPINQSAKDMMAAYFKAKPEASINPTEALPMTVGAAARPTLGVIGPAPEDEIITFGDMAERAADANAPLKVMSLAEANAQSRSGLL